MYNSFFYLIPVTLTPLSSSSFSKPPYLSPTCSTTRCHKNYLERPQNIETRNKKKKKIEQEKLEGKSLMLSYTLSIYSVSKWRQTLEMGLGDVPPPLHLFQPDRKYIRNMCFFELNQQVEACCLHI